MAHVGIVIAGYWGDVMPFMPVSGELASRDHRVTLAVPRGFHKIINAGPYELRHLGTDFSPRELADHGEVLERVGSPLGMRAAAGLWVRQLCIEPAKHIVGTHDDVAPDLWFVHPGLYWLTELAAAQSATPIVVGHLVPDDDPVRRTATSDPAGQRRATTPSARLADGTHLGRPDDE